MTELYLLIPALIIGIILGIIFFGGLWWTVKKGLLSTNPALWFLGSLLFRTTIVVSGFYFIAADNWQKLLTCLFGFTIMRFVIIHITRPPIAKKITQVQEENSHAS